MTNLLLRADDVLRCRIRAIGSSRLSRASELTILVCLFGSVYGAVMGTFGALVPGRLPQIFFSASKVPLLLFATFTISLPSFYVSNLLLGVGHDFRESARALVAAQAGVTIVLASLAPFTALFYVSFSDYTSAVLFNGAMFMIATVAGQWILLGYFRPLIQRNPRHRWLLWTWMLVYALVGIQMGWMLRPFIGSPTDPVHFFRVGEWTNAYEVVCELIWCKLHQ